MVVGATSRCFLGSQVLDGESRYQLATRGLPAGGETLASQMRGVMPRLIAQNDPHPGRLNSPKPTTAQSGRGRCSGRRSGLPPGTKCP